MMISYLQSNEVEMKLRGLPIHSGIATEAPTLLSILDVIGVEIYYLRSLSSEVK